jgi:hypothetical protein
MDIERSAMFDPNWRRRGKICGYEDAMGPEIVPRDDPMWCPIMEGHCPAGEVQAGRCNAGKSAVMSDDSALLRFMLPAGKDFYEDAQNDWRSGVMARGKADLEVAVLIAWTMWQKARVAESRGGLPQEEKFFAALHWFVMGLLWGGVLNPEDLVDLEVFTDDNSYFERLAEEDWGLDQFGPQLGPLTP